MPIRLLTPEHREAYDALALRTGTLFSSPSWLAVFGDRLLRYGIFAEDGSLVGGFFVYPDKKFGFRVWRNPPFTPECGPFLRIDATHPVAALEARRRLLAEVADFLDTAPTSLVLFPLTLSIEDPLPFYWKKFKVIPNITYVLDLSPSLDEIWMALSKTRRNDITKARKDGLVADLVQDPAIVTELVDQTFGRQDKEYPREEMHRILHDFATPDNSYAVVAKDGDRALACSFVVHDGRTAYYLLGGYRHTDKHHGAGALAVYEAMVQAKARGCAHFDFEGSILPPIERYFRGFGGRLTSYHTVNKAWLPLELLLKCTHRELF